MSEIRLIVTDFNKKNCHHILAQGKNFSLDDSMILWWIRLAFKQYIKNKYCGEFDR